MPLSRQLAYRQLVSGSLSTACASQQRLDPREHCLAAEDDPYISAMDLTVAAAAWTVAQESVPLRQPIEGVVAFIRDRRATSFADDIACVAAGTHQIDAAAVLHSHGRSYFGFHPRAIPELMTHDAV